MTEEIHDIGWAVRKMRAGRLVCRPSWNGKGMFLFLCYGTALREGLGPGPEECQPFITMKTAQDMMVPWVCSQSDLLADDWEISEQDHITEHASDCAIHNEPAYASEACTCDYWTRRKRGSRFVSSEWI